MNWKIVFIGGIADYAAMFLVSFATGYLIHSPEWACCSRPPGDRPNLAAGTQRGPARHGAALMPMWIATGLFGAFVAAGIYFDRAIVRWRGAAWQRGLSSA